MLDYVCREREGNFRWGGGYIGSVTALTRHKTTQTQILYLGRCGRRARAEWLKEGGLRRSKKKKRGGKKRGEERQVGGGMTHCWCWARDEDRRTNKLTKLLTCWEGNMGGEGWGIRWLVATRCSWGFWRVHSSSWLWTVWSRKLKRFQNVFHSQQELNNISNYKSDMWL